MIRFDATVFWLDATRNKTLQSKVCVAFVFMAWTVMDI